MGAWVVTADPLGLWSTFHSTTVYPFASPNSRAVFFFVLVASLSREVGGGHEELIAFLVIACGGVDSRTSPVVTTQSPLSLTLKHPSPGTAFPASSAFSALDPQLEPNAHTTPFSRTSEPPQQLPQR